MSKHLKRITVPRSWSIGRKAHFWATKPRPGPHSLERSVPLAIVLRDYLHVCDTAREARRILGGGEVLDPWAPRLRTRDLAIAIAQHRSMAKKTQGCNAFEDYLFEKE